MGNQRVELLSSLSSENETGTYLHHEKECDNGCGKLFIFF